MAFRCHSSLWMLKEVASLSTSEMISGHSFPYIFLTSFQKSCIRTLNEEVTRYFLLHSLHLPASLSTPILGCLKYQHSSPGCRPWLLKGCHSAESGPESTRDPHNWSFKKRSLPNHFPTPIPHFTSAIVDKESAKAPVFSLFLGFPLSSYLGWPEGGLRLYKTLSVRKQPPGVCEYGDCSCVWMWTLQNDSGCFSSLSTRGLLVGGWKKRRLKKNISCCWNFSKRGKERARERETAKQSQASLSLTSEAGTYCDKAVGSTRRDRERHRHREREKRGPPWPKELPPVEWSHLTF